MEPRGTENHDDSVNGELYEYFSLSHSVIETDSTNAQEIRVHVIENTSNSMDVEDSTEMQPPVNASLQVRDLSDVDTSEEENEEVDLWESDGYDLDESDDYEESVASDDEESYFFEHEEVLDDSLSVASDDSSQFNCSCHICRGQHPDPDGGNDDDDDEIDEDELQPRLSPTEVELDGDSSLSSGEYDGCKSARCAICFRTEKRQPLAVLPCCGGGNLEETFSTRFCSDCIVKSWAASKDDDSENFVDELVDVFCCVEEGPPHIVGECLRCKRLLSIKKSVGKHKQASAKTATFLESVGFAYKRSVTAKEMLLVLAFADPTYIPEQLLRRDGVDELIRLFIRWGIIKTAEKGALSCLQDWAAALVKRNTSKTSNDLFTMDRHNQKILFHFIASTDFRLRYLSQEEKYDSSVDDKIWFRETWKILLNNMLFLVLKAENVGGLSRRAALSNQCLTMYWASKGLLQPNHFPFLVTLMNAIFTAVFLLVALVVATCVAGVMTLSWFILRAVCWSVRSDKSFDFQKVTRAMTILVLRVCGFRFLSQVSAVLMCKLAGRYDIKNRFPVLKIAGVALTFSYVYFMLARGIIGFSVDQSKINDTISTATKHPWSEMFKFAVLLMAGGDECPYPWLSPWLWEKVSGLSPV